MRSAPTVLVDALGARPRIALVFVGSRDGPRATEVLMDRVHRVAAALGQRVSERLDHFRWLFLTRGIAAVVFGIAALVWPAKSLSFLVFLVGGYLLVDALSALYEAYRSGELGADLLQGLASVGVGAAVLLWPGITTSLLLALLGAWAVVQGVGLLLAGRRLAAEAESGSLLSAIGAGVTVFGVVALVWRGAGAVAVSWLIASVALIAGGLLILVARRLKVAETRLRTAHQHGA